MTAKDLTAAERTFVQHVGFKAGIIPIENPNNDFRRILKQLPPEEARKLKRKFRKLWRKQVTASNKSRFGVGKKTPSRTEKTARKRAVFDTFWKEEVKPLLERFMNPSLAAEQDRLAAEAAAKNI